MRSRFLIRVIALGHKEVLHIVRDIRVLYLALGLPVVMLVLFGFAVSFDLDRLPIALVDQDRTPASRHLADAMEASKAFVITERPLDPNAVEQLFRRGRVKAAVVVPPGFARKLARGERAEAQLLLDGADGTVAMIALGYAAGISQSETLRLLEASLAEQGAFVKDRIRVRFNPDMKSVRFIIPGLIAVILAILAVLLTALTVAREWEHGSMEQLFATPVGRLEIVLGKLLPYVAIGLMQVLLVLATGAIVFGVRVVGSLVLLFVTALLFLAGMLGQGLLISVVTKNQQLATQFGMLTAMLPTLLLSGFLTPVENMPPVLRAIAALVPARYFIRMLRGIMLKGTGATELLPDMGALGLFAVVMVILSTVRFQRGLD